MIWFVIVAVVVLYISWQFKAPSQYDYVSEETRIYYATGRQARRCAFVDWTPLFKKENQ
tara:strand:- start:10 stop:186 length:177 start_codon:yes stop_codon:yes gene_type:complete